MSCKCVFNGLYRSERIVVGVAEDCAGLVDQRPVDRDLVHRRPTEV